MYLHFIKSYIRVLYIVAVANLSMMTMMMVMHDDVPKFVVVDLLTANVQTVQNYYL